MKYILIIEFIINSILLLWFHMHMFQLNSYFFKKNMHWMKKNKTKIIIQFLLIAISSAFALIGSTWASIIGAIGLGVSILYNFPKGKKKIPLKLTSRVKRMFTTELILIILGMFIMGIQNYILEKLAIVNVVSLFLCMIANIINSPIEAMVRQWYINDAKKILKSCPNLIIIGVTGSYGKTSVKNFLGKTLSAKYEVLVTPKNYNTTMGVVRTIRENLKSTHQIFVCEMGATKVGDIKEICDLVKPTYGVVTSIGPQHLESFKSIENVIKTKLELADSVKANGGTIFLNCDNEYLKKQNLDMDVIKYGVNDESLDYYGYNLESSEKGVSFNVKDANGKGILFTTQAIGRYNIVNIMAAIAVANKLGVKLESMVSRVREIKNVDHRLQLLNKGGINVIDDSYNSNPVSSKSAIDTLGEFKGTKIIVTPGLIELGDKEDQYNFELGEYITKVCDYVFLVGKSHSKKILEGIQSKKYPEDKVFVVESPQEAMQKIVTLGIKDKITVLLENDLPDNYNVK
ncbi:MAG: UDP-N-acetylmuramoyl-tripeptide--D-alanyl-D-alanine ligase [Clostridia bacterium]|nr:UDP-N-acetylmuramoyl-tripeptide--D-alanyl-D-alanine ligase [Clostridia bacterium]